MNSQPVSMYEQSQAKRKRLFIIAGASIALVIVVVIIIRASSSSESSCQLVDSHPDIDVDKIKALPSTDYRTLVRFAGYLMIKRGHSTGMKYLELKLRKVQRFDQNDGTILVRLYTDCAYFDIRVVSLKGDKGDYNKILDYTTRPLESETQFDICSYKSDFTFGLDEYYFCHKVGTLECQGDRNAGWLHNSLETYAMKILVLDFELDGRTSAVESGYFEKIAKSC